MNMFAVKKVIKGANNRIIGYELNSGSIVDVEEAIHLAMNGELSNVSMVYRNGADGEINGVGINTSNLPEIK